MNNLRDYQSYLREGIICKHKNKSFQQTKLPRYKSQVGFVHYKYVFTGLFGVCCMYCEKGLNSNIERYAAQ